MIDEDRLQKASWLLIAQSWAEFYAICFKAADYDDNLAEELMSDCVYVKVPHIITRWNEGPKLAPLAHYAKSMLYWYVRKHLAKARKREKQHDCSLNDWHDMDGAKDESHTAIEVQSMLESLNKRDYTIVTMILIEQYTLAETARHLNISIGHVSARLNKAKRKLRDRYGDEWTTQ